MTSPIINDLDFTEVENDPSLKYLFDNFLIYSSHIVQEKAIPSIADGLLPTQRRYLLAMAQLGCGSNSKTLKSTTIGSYVTGNLSPQGNPYSVLVGQSQYYRVPQMLFKPSGNFGEPEANAASADRYTESRLSPFAEKVFLEDIPSKPVLPIDEKEPDIVPYQNTYTNTHKEPEYLPSKIPSLLVNGNNGIGVSISQTWTPLAFKSFIQEYISYLEGNPIDYTKLRFGHPSNIKVISTQNEFIESLKTGHGSVRVAPSYNLLKSPRGKLLSIEVLACPPYVSLNDIGDNFNQWKNKDSDCPFESYTNNSYIIKDSILGVSVTEVKLTFALKTRNQISDLETINRYISLLYSKTGLIQSYTVNMTALDLNKYPREYTLESYLKEWTDFRENTIKKIALYNLEKVKNSLHRQKILLTVQREFEEFRKLFDTCEDKESLENGVRNLLVSSESFEKEISSEDISYVLSIPLASIVRINFSLATDRLAKLQENRIKFLSLVERREARIRYIIRENQEILENMGKYMIREIVNEFEESLSDILSNRPSLKKAPSLEFTFEPDEENNDLIITTEKGCFIRVGSKSVKSLPYKLNLSDGDSIAFVEYTHSSKLLFITQQGKFLLVPCEKMEYGISYPSASIINFSTINKSLVSEHLTYVAPRAKKPTHLYVEDSIYFKGVNISSLSYRASVKMKNRINRAYLVDKIYDSNGNERKLTSIEYNATRIGSLPKLYHYINVVPLYPLDKYKINIEQPNCISKIENSEIKSNSLLENLNES